MSFGWLASQTDASSVWSNLRLDHTLSDEWSGGESNSINELGFEPSHLELRHTRHALRPR